MTDFGGNGINRPATGISWYEAAKYVNWLNTSTGGTAAYKFSGSTFQLWSAGDAGYNANNPFRNSLAKYWLPSSDEWYKGAYGSPSGTWYNFATGSDTIPTAVTGGTNASSAVYSQTSAGPADITNAGGLSDYGTMAQSGNIHEWMETATDGINNSAAENRDWRGGRWTDGGSSNLNASSRFNSLPTDESATIRGFRVASADLTALDSDGDGLSDAVETNTGTYVSATNTGTHPNIVDTDGDTLLDGAEVALGTNPTNPDTDGDKVPDGVEVTNGTNPLNPASNPLPVIVTQPVGGTKNVGESWSFTVVATDPTSSFLAYQWKKNGVNFRENSFDPTLSFASLQISDAGSYEVLISNPLGNTTSSVVTLVVNLSADTTAPVVTLNGANPLTINKGSVFSDPGATVTDNVDATRTITGSGTVNTATVGNYTRTYNTTDAAGNPAVQVTRTVNVVLDPSGDEDGDGVTNGAETSAGTNPYEGDSDSDGVSDGAELAAGTNPNNSASAPNLPIAVADAFTAKLVVGMTTKVTTASLISNDKYSGIPGETRGVTFVSAATTSTGGASIRIKGGWLIYQPSPTATIGTDTFTYTVSNGVRDAAGTLKTATGTVTVSLVSPDMTIEVALVSPPTVANGYKATFLVMPGLVFEAYGSNTLGGAYVKIGTTFTSASSGKLEVTDSAAAVAPSRFYKLKWIP